MNVNYHAKKKKSNILNWSNITKSVWTFPVLYIIQFRTVCRVYLIMKPIKASSSVSLDLFYMLLIDFYQIYGFASTGFHEFVFLFLFCFIHRWLDCCVLTDRCLDWFYSSRYIGGEMWPEICSIGNRSTIYR